MGRAAGRAKSAIVGALAGRAKGRANCVIVGAVAGPAEGRAKSAIVRAVAVIDTVTESAIVGVVAGRPVTTRQAAHLSERSTETFWSFVLSGFFLNNLLINN